MIHLPSAFILLPAKDADTYKKMIRMLKEGALKVVIISDLEGYNHKLVSF